MAENKDIFNRSVFKTAVFAVFLVAGIRLFTCWGEGGVSTANSSDIAADAGQGFSVSGVINYGTSESDLSVRLNHRFARSESAAFFALAGLGDSYDAGGIVSVDVTVNGRLKEPNSLKTNGLIKLRDCSLYCENSLVAADVNATISLEGDRYEIEEFSSRIFNGLVTGKSCVVNKAGTMEVSGQITGEKIDLAQLSRFSSGVRKFKKGMGSFEVSLDKSGNGPGLLRGSGEIFIDDADVSSFPVLAGIFNTIGLAGVDPLSASDAEMVFDFSGTVLTIKSARIANRFSAIEAESGGTIDLRARQIDIHVMAVGIYRLQGILESIPIVNLFVELKDKLTRLRIKGGLDEPPARLITKQPVRDVTEATLGFFAGVLKTGGQLKGTYMKTKGLMHHEEKKQ